LAPFSDVGASPEKVRQPRKRKAAFSRGLSVVVNVAFKDACCRHVQIHVGQSGGLLHESTASVFPMRRAARSRIVLNLGSSISYATKVDADALR